MFKSGEVPPEDEDESSEIKEDLTDDEVEIRGYLVNGEPPSDELFKKFTEQFWFNEPYKYVCTYNPYDF